MWYKNVGTDFFCVVTMHAFDRQSDRQTDRNETTIGVARILSGFCPLFSPKNWLPFLVFALKTRSQSTE